MCRRLGNLAPILHYLYMAPFLRWKLVGVTTHLDWAPIIWLLWFRRAYKCVNGQVGVAIQGILISRSAIFFFRNYCQPLAYHMGAPKLWRHFDNSQWGISSDSGASRFPIHRYDFLRICFLRIWGFGGGYDLQLTYGRVGIF